MIRFRVRSLGLLAMACVLGTAGCSLPHDPVAGTKGGTETTNGRIQGTVVDGNSVPVPGTRAYLIDAGNWLADAINGESSVLDSAVADAQGRFSLRVPPGARCNAQLSAGGRGGFFADVGRDTGETSRTFVLAPLVPIQGAVAGSEGSVEAVYLAGSLYRGSVGAGGAYAIPGVARGTFGLVARMRGGEGEWLPCRPVTVKEGTATVTADASPEAGRVLLDGFEAGQFPAPSLLGAVVGGGDWYTVSDRVEGGSSTVAVGDASGGDAWQGMSRRMVFTVGGPEVDPAYGIVGVQVGRSDHAYPAATSRLRALSFMLKGSGKILVSLVDTVLDQGARNRRIHFDTSVTASGAWTRVEIPVAGLRVTEDALGMENGKRWDEPVHSLKIIRFMATSSLSGAGDTVDITLDDIRLEGVNLRDFIH